MRRQGGWNTLNSVGWFGRIGKACWLDVHHGGEDPEGCAKSVGKVTQTGSINSEKGWGTLGSLGRINKLQILMLLFLEQKEVTCGHFLQVLAELEVRICDRLRGRPSCPPRAYN